MATAMAEPSMKHGDDELLLYVWRPARHVWYVAMHACTEVQVACDAVPRHVDALVLPDEAPTQLQKAAPHAAYAGHELAIGYRLLVGFMQAAAEAPAKRARTKAVTARTRMLGFVLLGGRRAERERLESAWRRERFLQHTRQAERDDE